MFGPIFQRGRQAAIEAAERIGGRILEVGIGTGIALRDYSPKNRIVGIDISELMLEKARARVSEMGLTHVEQLAVMDASELQFPDNSFDVVMAQYVVSTVPRPEATLDEFARVLKPGGRFIFLEHGRSEDVRTARLQDLLNPVQKFIGCGCNLNRSIDRVIKESGLRIDRLDRFLMPHTPRVLGAMYRGVAFKDG